MATDQDDQVVVEADGRPEFTGAATSTVWQLDLLGNWSDPTGEEGAAVLHFADADDYLAFSANDTLQSTDHHTTNGSNEIGERTYYDPATMLDAETKTFLYDPAGNLTFDGVHKYYYDAWNRLVRVEHSVRLGRGEETWLPLLRYDYDALGRRVARYDEEADTADYFYYDGNRVVEEWHDDDTDNQFNVPARRRQYVWGLDYIDELVEQTNGSGETGDPATTYFVHQDANYNVVALTGSNGGLFEQYSYTPYGEPFAVENGGGEVLPSGVPSTNIGHQGLWREFLVDFYHNRARTYCFKLGRFGQRDRNGTGTALAAGLARNAQRQIVLTSLAAGQQYRDGVHLYAYVRGMPINRTDAGGLQVKDVALKRINTWSDTKLTAWIRDLEAAHDFDTPARNNCIPVEVLKAQVAGEQLDIGWTERWITDPLLGGSVGLAQLTVNSIKREQVLTGSETADLYKRGGPTPPNRDRPGLRSPGDAFESALRHRLLHDDAFNLEMAARLIAKYLDLMCETYKSREMSPYFRRVLSSGCELEDFCLRKLRPCSEIVQLDAPQCLIQAVSATMNDSRDAITHDANAQNAEGQGFTGGFFDNRFETP